jgi:hypothetical protein
VPTTRTGIEYDISCKGSGSNPTERKERWVPGASQVYEVVRVAWGDWDQFNIDMLGSNGWIDDGSGGFKLDRLLPETHPAYDWMIATNTELLEAPAATGPGGRAFQFFADFDEDQEIVAGVTFESVLYDLADNATAWAGGEIVRYVERTFNFAVDNLTQRGTQLQFVDNGGIVGTEPALVFPASQLHYVWKRVPCMLPNKQFPPKLYANIGATMGRVNSDTFDGLPPYSLLCGAPEIRQEVGPNGRREFEVRYPMSQRPLISPATQPWNSKYRTKAADNVTIAPGFYDVQIANSGGERPYKAVPFANLFKNA